MTDFKNLYNSEYITRFDERNRRNSRRVYNLNDIIPHYDEQIQTPTNETFYKQCMVSPFNKMFLYKEILKEKNNVILVLLFIITMQTLMLWQQRR